jgi:ABC-type Zn2+ transport system substrate-binding protein/surface adhesin
MITKSTEVKQVSVDILASNILSDRNGYATLIYGVLSDIENCSRL